MDRRQLLRTGLATTLAGGLTASAAKPPNAPAQPGKSPDPPAAGPASEPPKTDRSARRPLPIGVSTYSFWQFKRTEFRPIDRCLELAADLGFDGVEILHRQMEDESPGALHAIKRRALTLGLPLMGFSTHQGFLRPDPVERKKNVDHTNRCLELAARLGIPTMRVNTGRWDTSRSFDELMANRGIEPIRPGCTEEQGYQWVIDALGECARHAEKLGVVMGLENHWGLGLTPEGVLRIVEAVKSPWLEVTLDTGCFLDDMYPKFAKLAPRAVLVQAKTYMGGGTWYTLDIDYDRVSEILRKANYRGWVSLEFEGKSDPVASCRESLALFRRCFR
jgi:sugar phosphate isomerase/epimerase